MSLQLNQNQNIIYSPPKPALFQLFVAFVSFCSKKFFWGLSGFSLCPEGFWDFSPEVAVADGEGPGAGEIIPGGVGVVEVDASVGTDAAGDADGGFVAGAVEERGELAARRRRRWCRRS